MEIGKLPNEVLDKIVFGNIKTKREEVLLGPGIGEDTAIIDFGKEVCVLSTDPITGATKDIGHLAIHISVNDVASSGAEPIAVLLTILAPSRTREEDLKIIMKDASLAAKELNIEIAGGHTEITEAVNQVVISTTVIGKQKKESIIDKAKIEIGDKILLSKKIGIEGTSILAKELEDELKDKLTKEELTYAKNMDKDLSVLKEGLIAGNIGVNYMHDITEGGILGAIWEAGEAINKGVRIEKDLIPIDRLTEKISKILEIDPYKLISSGSMIMIAKENKVEELKNEMRKENIDLTVIGDVIEKGKIILEKGREKIIDSPESDDLYKGLKHFN